MSHEPHHLLRAAWVAPMDGPAIRDGAVVFAGSRVVAVGEIGPLRTQYPAAVVRDFGNAVILPALVNAHTHLELSHLAPPPYRGVFIDWLFDVLRSASPTSDAAMDAVRTGAGECLRFGVTAVGDVASAATSARRALAASPLRAVSFGEVVGMAGRRAIREPRLAAAVDAEPTGPRLTPGVSPHAPYSIDADGYRQCLAAAAKRGLALTTHLAESPHEAEFLSDHAGPFRELWEKIGAWDDSVPRFHGGPIRFAQALGLLDYPLASLAHVNYCDDDELAIVAGGKASVVYCPRTHAYFGHPPHRWRDMLAAGINVAVGTDSRASSPDLNLVDDLRLMHRLAPEVPPQTLWEMATARGARALGIEAVAGTLSPGKADDCVIFPAESDDPLAEILEGNAMPLSTAARGREQFRAAR